MRKIGIVFKIDRKIANGGEFCVDWLMVLSKIAIYRPKGGEFGVFLMVGILWVGFNLKLLVVEV